MADITRIERILIKLAERLSPNLAKWAKEQQLKNTTHWERMLARKFADSYSTVVILADEFTPEMRLTETTLITNWVKGYQQFHRLIARTMFPSLNHFKAQYADDKMPPVIVLTIEPSPIANIFAGYVQPYLAVRQSQSDRWSELELRGLMDMILDELQAREFPPAVQDEMRRSGVALLAGMLQSKVRHLSLTDFDGQVLSKIQLPESKPATPRPQNLPGEKAPIPPNSALDPNATVDYALPDIPDTDSDSRFTKTRDMFRVDVPLPRTGPLSPPLPRIKNDDEDKKK